MDRVAGALREKGKTWDESSEFVDPVTLRKGRKYTKCGLFNTTPTYHTNSAFTADADHFIFVRGTEDGKNALFKACTNGGEITQLTDVVNGLGHWGSIQRKEKGPYADGNGISAGTLCIAPNSRVAAYNLGRSLRLVHLDTLEETVLVDDLGKEWGTGVMSIDSLEQEIVFPAQSAHPDLIQGRQRTRDYREAIQDHLSMGLYRASMTTGKTELIYEERGFGCSHVAHCPTDKNLILMDRDNAGEINRFESRCFILNVSTGEKTEIRPRNRHRFQTHAAWTWDGQRIVYHGRAYGGGWFIGVSDRGGKIIREWHFPKDYYGHVAAAADRPAIILDGNLTEDSLLWLYYDAVEPRIEVIAQHNTEWGSCPGQVPHPHAQNDRSGRYVLYNASHGRHSDVYTISTR